MENIYKACLKFRSKLNKVPKEQLSISFREFPHGSCGDTCLLLGAYLHSRGLGIFDYVCGERNEMSHAWLEKDGIIVDITGDQFEDSKVEVFVGTKNSFYESFEEDFRHIYYESLEGHSIKSDRLWRDYSVICQDL